MSWVSRAIRHLLHHHHDWRIFHPLAYQANVRMRECVYCGKIRDRGVWGEYGIIQHGFDAKTWRTLFG